MVLWVTPGLISEHKPKSNLWVPLSMTPKQTKTIVNLKNKNKKYKIVFIKPSILKFINFFFVRGSGIRFPRSAWGFSGAPIPVKT